MRCSQKEISKRVELARLLPAPDFNETEPVRLLMRAAVLLSFTLILAPLCSGASPEVFKPSAQVSSPVQISPLTDSANRQVLARIENENLKVEFVAATRMGMTTARPVVSLKTATGWKAVPLDASAESYQVLTPNEEVRFEIGGFHPRWTRNNSKGVTTIWKAAEGREAIVREVTQLAPNRLKLSFYSMPGGSLEAIWELQPAEKTIRVGLEFTPVADGQVSLGYFLFNQKPLEMVDALLMPMLVQGKRFPSKDYTMLQSQSPTPVSLVQIGTGAEALTWGVSGDPVSTPFEFPIPAKPRYGLHIRSPQGAVQPSIYGPLLGTRDSKAKAGEPVKFTFRVLLQAGDWYAAYRSIADGVFGWRDYRSNGSVSLTEAALNMLELYMDDQHGGWWQRAKAPYQVESKNGSTQSSPMTAVSLYRLTGDTELYRRRTLPTVEFLLSRSGPHFSPIPENTGGYPKGSMQGPVNIYGTTTYAGIWEMTNRRTPALRDIAFAKEGSVRMTSTQQNFQSHNQPFDEWLGRYLFNGEKSALQRAIAEADAYIQTHIKTLPSDEPGLNPFFLMAYTPAWEGLLRLYEVTKEKRFLDAAAEGARLVMTGMWTQPRYPEGAEVTINPGGYLHGDKLTHMLFKGGEVFRLGWPRRSGDTPEKKVPSWMISNVGLGFEQPSTYTYKENGGRLILQAPWAPYFLRLAQYTGDSQFETYARNAVVGRWSNYPGYYYTAFSDLAQDPRYPYTGPDMGFFYYHHIIVHLSWVLDYLVSEAAMRSGGEIQFPGLRQFGYAYFDNLLYGHAPGNIMGCKDAWLWLRKDLLAVDNPQINFLTAHSRDKFFVILMNQSQKLETVCLTFQPSRISKGSENFKSARVITGKGGELSLERNAGKITLDPRGLAVLEVAGLDIEVPAHQIRPEPESWEHPGHLKRPSGDGNELCAAAIQIEPGPWDAFVWSTAGSGSLRQLTLSWRIGAQSGTLEDLDYPYEFSVPVPAGQTAFSYSVSGTKADGTTFRTEEMTIGVGR